MQLPVLRVLDGKSKVWLRRERMGKEMLFPFHVLFGTWPEIRCNPWDFFGSEQVPVKPVQQCNLQQEGVVDIVDVLVGDLGFRFPRVSIRECQGARR